METRVLSSYWIYSLVGRDRALAEALKETLNTCQNSKYIVQFGKTFKEVNRQGFDKMHFDRALI